MPSSVEAAFMRNMEFSAYKTIDNPRRAKRRRSCNTHASSPRSGANAQRPQKRTRTEDEHPVGSSTPRQPRLYGKTPMATVLNHPHYGVLQHGPNPVDPRELHRRELVFHTTYPGMPDYHVGDKNAATERQPKLESLSPKSPPPPDIRGVRGQERPAERRSMVEISSSDDDDMGDIPYAPVDKREAVGGETEVSRGGRCYKDATAQGSARDSDKVTPRNMKSVTDDDWDPSEDEIADPGSGASDSFGHGVRPGRRRVNQKRRALEQSRTNNAQFDGGRDSTGFDIATPPAESLLHVQNDLVTLWAPRKTNKVEPEFRKGKRLVKRDGYSMTPNAIDQRARKAQETRLKERMAAMLDAEIAAGVEGEGWGTPMRRLYKAVVRQLELAGVERAGGNKKGDGNGDGDKDRRPLAALKAENERPRRAVAAVVQVAVAVARVDAGDTG